jgi:hypothetical protein
MAAISLGTWVRMLFIQSLLYLVVFARINGFEFVVSGLLVCICNFILSLHMVLFIVILFNIARRLPLTVNASLSWFTGWLAILYWLNTGFVAAMLLNSTLSETFWWMLHIKEGMVITVIIIVASIVSVAYAKDSFLQLKSNHHA